MASMSFSEKCLKATNLSRRLRTCQSKETDLFQLSQSSRAESWKYQKKVSTWSYKVPPYLRCS